MSIDWPAEVPFQPSANSFSVAPIEEVTSTDFDQGPSRRRRRFTKLLGEASFTVPMTNAQHQTFIEFYRSTLYNGAQWFRMQLYQGGFVAYEVRFVEPFKAVMEGPRYWRISLKLCVRDYFFARSEGAVWFTETYGAENLRAWSADIHQELHFVVPIKLAFPGVPI